MENKNRYEEVPQKENPFLKVLKVLGAYFKGIGFDFVQSFKYNNMKLASLLVMIPGALLGFFLHWHSVVVRALVFEQSGGQYYKNMSFPFAGMLLFVLMLFGILNIFNALSMSKKKNLGSVVMATIFTAIITICGILYIWIVFTYVQGRNEYYNAYQQLIASGVSADQAAEQLANVGISASSEFSFDSNYVVSIASIIFCIVSSIVGVVFGYINYDRTYEKVDR